MKIRVRISTNENTIDLEKALNNMNLQIIKEEIVPNNRSTGINLSTLLVDDEGVEIFENDIVADSDGREFKIVYHSGGFWASTISSKPMQLEIPLLILQSKGCVPVRVQPR